MSRLAAAARGATVPEPAELDLGARQASSSRLGELATRIPPGYTWDDLVVPDRQRELLGSRDGIYAVYPEDRYLSLTGFGLP